MNSQILKTWLQTFYGGFIGVFVMRSKVFFCKLNRILGLYDYFWFARWYNLRTIYFYLVKFRGHLQKYD